MPLLAADFGDDLLRQYVQRSLRYLQAVQLAAAYAIEQCRAFDQVVARQREQPAFGRALDLVPGAPDPLQKRGNRTGRADLAHQLDFTDIDAQLQRGGGHQHLQLTALEPLLGVQAVFLGHAAVVRSHGIAAQALAQMAGQAFGQAPGVDEHQGGAMLAGQGRQTVVNQAPDISSHHRPEWHRRYFQAQVTGTGMADIDDGALARLACQKLRHPLDRSLRGRQADAPQCPATQRFKALQAQGQMTAALVAGQGVDLIDNHRVYAGQALAPGGRAEQHIQRFGGGDQDMRRLAAHGRAFLLRGVATAYRRTDFQRLQALFGQHRVDPGQRRLQVDLDIVGQCLEWRDVEHLGLVRQVCAGQALFEQLVEDRQEGGQGFA
ncbi:hypothetical protein D3C79_720610 [compost metagenome]